MPTTQNTDTKSWVNHIPLEERAKNVDRVVHLLSKMMDCETLVTYYSRQEVIEKHNAAARRYSFFPSNRPALPEDSPDWAGLDNDPCAITARVTFAPKNTAITALKATIRNEQNTVKHYNAAINQLAIEQSTARSLGRYIVHQLNQLSQHIQSAAKVPFAFSPPGKDELTSPNDTTFSIGFSTAPSALPAIIAYLEEVEKNPKLIDVPLDTHGITPKSFADHAAPPNKGGRSF
jgi:rubrerythrin